MNNLLEVRGLSKTYGSGSNRLEVLSRIDLDLQSGTTTALIGASGAISGMMGAAARFGFRRLTVP